MSEIMNRLLLIASSSILLLIIFPAFNPIFEEIKQFNISENVLTTQEEINRQISTFNKNLKNFIDSKTKTEEVYLLDIKKNKTVFWYNYDLENVCFNFVIYQDDNNFPISFETKICGNLSISKKYFFFDQYSLSRQNSTVFLTFI